MDGGMCNTSIVILRYRNLELGGIFFFILEKNYVSLIRGQKDLYWEVTGNETRIKIQGEKKEVR